MTVLKDYSSKKDLTKKESKIAKALKELHDLKFALDEAATVSITDVFGRIVYVNDKFCDVSGYSREELIGKTHKIVNAHYHSKEFFQKMWTTIKSGKTWNGEVLNKSKNGSDWWAAVTIAPLLDNNGEPYQYIAIRSDITERKIMEEEIKQKKEELLLSEARFRSLVQNSHELISILDSNGNLLYMNSTAEKISGFQMDELMGKCIFDYIYPDEQDKAKKEYRELLNQLGETVKSVYRLKHADGSWLYCELILTNFFHEKSINGIVCNLRDITENIKAEEQIKYMAYYDHLTSLPNRRFFEEQITKEFNLAKEAGTVFALLFLDLDGFKLINDSLGHGVGDKLLKEVACRLHNRISENSFVARMGGDEFTVIIRDIIDDKQINKILQQILHLFQEPFIIDHHELFITTSIGVSMYPDNGNSVQELVKNADLAMYLAKDQGKNQYNFIHLQ